MKRFLLGFLRGLKLPIKLLKGWLKKRKKQSKLERKCYRHIRLNFTSNISWGRGFRKKKQKNPKNKRKFFRKKTNNSS